mmetsp:Transcript_53034/g.68000  ORF Transcript_53034/g.68000 Transcript_53034/m.68000 type:complete len:235 (-) Transcript_53034:122-826(-)|eukprot:CAMPEP_0114354752 /NCGR_PEP_ID=MMETSP0101-20121206/19720_1 /TAXON_ID=38822 ORGANISM="Pteridomonas danica, Strain PT" /NCGR_SAMPLE_ID=MMETSP0101 /ASSEMBLY_ACC=CAM_ASM_000211 /LENGTH=234 /DNA_ID=CAMNT_0001496387 /DNA_START=638 /DNA_END=1342 /DNA_ORIENTATION=+
MCRHDWVPGLPEDHRIEEPEPTQTAASDDDQYSSRYSRFPGAGGGGGGGSNAQLRELRAQIFQAQIRAMLQVALADTRNNMEGGAEEEEDGEDDDYEDDVSEEELEFGRGVLPGGFFGHLLQQSVQRHGHNSAWSTPGVSVSGSTTASLAATPGTPGRSLASSANGSRATSTTASATNTPPLPVSPPLDSADLLNSLFRRRLSTSSPLDPPLDPPPSDSTGDDDRNRESPEEES